MGNGAVGKIPHPAAFEYPNLLRLRPSGTRCENAAAQLEICWINFQNAKSTEQVLRRVKEIVIVNLVVFSKDPALGMSVRLRGPSLDLVMQGILSLVRIRKVRVVHQDHSGRQRQSSEKERHSQAVEARTARFYRHDFVVLAHYPESDEHCHQRSQWEKIVKQERRQIAEVVHHDKKGHFVPSDVVEQIEQRKRLIKENENRHQESEVIEKTSQDVQIHQPGKAASGGSRALRRVSCCGAGCGGPCTCLGLTATLQANPLL